MYKIVVEIPEGLGGGGYFSRNSGNGNSEEKGGGDLREILSMVGNGYFLELHNPELVPKFTADS